MQQGRPLLDPDELVTEIQIPKPSDGVMQSYLKFTLRDPVDFAIVSVASAITDRKRVVCGCAYCPWGRCPSPCEGNERPRKSSKADPSTHKAAAEAAEQAVAGVMPLTMNAYKVEIVKTLAKRAILS